MNTTVYVLSGLGADERAFQRLDWGNTTPVFIRWIPLQPSETIENYAIRLLPQIKTTNPILMGLSFGGIIAVELAKKITIQKLILVSSAKNKNEIPKLYRLLGKVKFHLLFPAALFKQVNFFTYYFFGLQGKVDKAILRKIIKETDSKFLKWAIDKVVNWRNIQKINQCFHIHGTSDRILPINHLDVDVQIKGGGHLMVLTHAQQISREIQRLIIE